MSSPLSITEPVVGGDTGSWGSKLNTALTAILNRLNGHAQQHEPGGFDDLSSNYMPVFTPEAYGAVGNGSTDDTAAINAAISAAQSAGGGTVLLKEKTYLCSGAITPTYSGTGTSTLQKPVRITGPISGGWNGFWASAPLNGGAVLDLRYDGTDTLHPAKIDTRGGGLLEIDHVTLVSGGTDNLPFVQTTNTTVHLHHLVVIGNQANTGTACLQDFIYLGGTTTTVGNGSTAAFQGYGSRINDCYFSHIRRHVTWRTYANSVFVDHITTSTTCGSAETHGAPYVFDSAAGSTVGNVLADCLIEVTNYPHAVALLNNAISNDFRGLAAWDASGTTLSAVYVTPAQGNTYNRVTGGYIVATKPFLDDTDGTTTLVTGAQGVPSVFSQGLAVRGPNTYGLRFGAQGSTTDDWTLNRLTAAEIKLSPATFASSIIDLVASTTRLGDPTATSYLACSAISNHEYIQALGSNTDINLNLQAKGAGQVVTSGRFNAQAIVVRTAAQTLASAGTITQDASQCEELQITLQANLTGLTLNGSISSGQRITVVMKQDATGGRTYVWDPNMKFAGNVAPSDTTANTQTSVTFVWLGGWRERSRAVAVPN